MNRSIVQRILSVSDSEEACALLKSFLSQLRNFEQFLPVCEKTVLFTVSYYVFSDSRIYPRYI